MSPDDLRQILGLMLNKESALLETRGMTLEVDEGACTWLLAQNDHPEWGARPLRRIIQRFLREPLADYLLEHDPPKQAVVKVTTEARCNPASRLPFRPARP